MAQWHVAESNDHDCYTVCGNNGMGCEDGPWILGFSSENPSGTTFQNFLESDSVSGTTSFDCSTRSFSEQTVTNNMPTLSTSASLLEGEYCWAPRTRDTSFNCSDTSPSITRNRLCRCCLLYTSPSPRDS